MLRYTQLLIVLHLLVDRSSVNTAAATGQIVKFLGVTTAYTSPAATKSILIGGTFSNLTQNDINIYVEVVDQSAATGPIGVFICSIGK